MFGVVKGLKTILLSKIWLKHVTTITDMLTLECPYKKIIWNVYGLTIIQKLSIASRCCSFQCSRMVFHLILMMRNTVHLIYFSFIILSFWELSSVIDSPKVVIITIRDEAYLYNYKTLLWKPKKGFQSVWNWRELESKISLRKLQQKYHWESLIRGYESIRSKSSIG